MIERYLVSTPGRVGSHIVTACIRSAGKPTRHTHNPFLKTDNDSITALILVSRRDLFATVMSNCITWHTGQSVRYTKTEIAPFQVDLDDFQIQYHRQRWYVDSHDFTRPYGLIETLYFEDFIDNYNYIFEKLKLIQQPKLLNAPQVKNTFTPPAPYNYKQVVANHTECRVLFNYLEQSAKYTPWKEEEIYTGLKELNETWE